MIFNTIDQVCDQWRLMKVKHGDSHIGQINKIATIEKFGLRRHEIAYPGPQAQRDGSSNIEVFGFIRDHGRVVSMNDLRRALQLKKRATIEFRSLCRNTGKVRRLGNVRFERAAA